MSSCGEELQHRERVGGLRQNLLVSAPAWGLQSHFTSPRPRVNQLIARLAV